VKKRDLTEFIRDVVQPSFPDLAHSDLILYAKPIDSILRGFTFSPSLRSPNKFSVSVFARPLFVPSENPLGQFFKRVKRGLVFDQRDAWNIQEFESEAVRSKLVRGIQRKVGLIPSLSNPSQFAENATRVFGKRNIDSTDFAVGLAYARCGELGKSRRRLQRLLDRGPSRSRWKHLGTNVVKVVGLIDSGEEDQLHKLLESWELGTIELIESFGFKAEGPIGWPK